LEYYLVTPLYIVLLLLLLDTFTIGIRFSIWVSNLWMVTTRNSGAMEERVEGLEKRLIDHS